MNDLIGDMLFFELLQLAAGTRTRLSASPGADEWQAAYEECRRQACLGVVFEAVAQMRSRGDGATERLPRRLFVKWAYLAGQIAETNRVADEDSREACRMLADDDLRCVVLKGQGNARMYPNPYARQSGDVDVLMVPALWTEMRSDAEYDRVVVARVRERLRDLGLLQRLGYMETTVALPLKTTVEVHYRTMWVANPWCNSRLQHWHRECLRTDRLAVWCPETQVMVPTWEYNVVFQLCHVFRHFFAEGIGMRQLMDYFFLLQRPHTVDDATLSAQLRRFGLYDFAAALMWVLAEVLAMPSERMIVPANERRGRMLLQWVMREGNFGKHDPEKRYGKLDRWHFKLFVRRCVRSVRLFGFAPGETFWQPWGVMRLRWWAITHELWR